MLHHARPQALPQRPYARNPTITNSVESAHTRGCEELLRLVGSTEDAQTALGGLDCDTGSVLSAPRHLHACRRACMARKLYLLLAPRLQVRWCNTHALPFTAVQYACAAIHCCAMMLWSSSWL